DKVVLEVPAPADGVLAEIKVSDGSTVTSGDLLAVVNAEAAGATRAAPAPARPNAGAATPPQAAAQSAPAAAAVEDPAARADVQKRLSPSVRRLGEEHGIDPTSVSGSGRSGRITKSDVVAFLDREPAASPAAAAAPISATAGARAPAAGRSIPAGE